MTKKEAFEEINKIQDFYVDELVALITNPNYESLKTINFTSPTGTGKTKMMGKLINRFKDYFFIITTLSKGQLHIQTRTMLANECPQKNFIVYGSADYKINSVLEANDIIDRIPPHTPCIWLRDEGHIRTNRFDELLLNYCYRVINFSATNQHSDIKCNFVQTMMLRTVNQTNGTPEDAIKKLLEIKQAHKNVKNYNPCAIFRCIGNKSDDLYKEILKLCRKNNLKYINITEDSFTMAELCKDDNEYDVIINKYKIIEGIDIRRAHVLFMDNQPENNATTIQAIGRCRRNALLYRNDIDILAPENEELLKQTRECFVFFNVKNMKIETDETGELSYAFCNHISCEELKTDSTIEVVNGQLQNGLYIIELSGQTGKFCIKKDKNTGFNIVEPTTQFYQTIVKHYDDNYLYLFNKKIHKDNVKKLPVYHNGSLLFYDEKMEELCKTSLYYYDINNRYTFYNQKCLVSDNVMQLFAANKKEFTYDFIYSKIKNNCVDTLLQEDIPYNIGEIKSEVDNYANEQNNTRDFKKFRRTLIEIRKYHITVSGFNYPLKDLCTEKELLLLSYFCFKKREFLLSTRSYIDYSVINSIISNFIELKSKYFYVKYQIEYKILSIFNNKATGHTLAEAEELINNYLIEKSKNSNFDDFCEIISNIKDKNLSDTENNSRFIQLQNACNDIELTIIQFSCIKEKELEKTNSTILKQIDSVLALKHNFYLSLKNDTEAEKVAYIILSKETRDMNSVFHPLLFSVDVEYPARLNVTENDIKKYFCNLNDYLNSINEKAYFLFADSKLAINSFLKEIDFIEQTLKSNAVQKVNYLYNALLENPTIDEFFLTENRYLPTTRRISLNELNKLTAHEPYDKIINDEESSIVGVDLMKQINFRNDVIWIESKNVTSKINSYNKFNSFLSKKYADELAEAKTQYFSGKNNFDFDTTFNSMIGYCVEYYSKYLVFGESYLNTLICKIKKESHLTDIDDYVIIRACILKYKEMMILSFGKDVSKFIRAVSPERLSQKKYENFVNLVIELGTKTAEYVKNTLYKNICPKDNIDPNLSINHIAGLADYITKDTVLDVKVKNYINEKSVRQVLAYHYLSTKRSDLKIKRVIVYDAVSDKAVTVNITNKNIKN